MAKKKKSKTADASNVKFSAELTGLLLILIGLVGFGFGPVGSFIKKFAMFLVGGWAWIFLLIFLLFLGFYVLFKRKLPKFFTQRLVGFYVIVTIILVASHFGFIEKCNGPGEIFKATIDQFMDRISTIGNSTALLTSGDTSIEIGGGIIGAIFAALLSALFGGLTGTKIVCVILLLFGLILFFNITFSDILEKIKNIFTGLKNHEDGELENARVDKPLKGMEPKIYDYNEEENIDNPVKDDRIVITSMDELKTIGDSKENLELPKKETIYEANPNYTLPPLSILDDPKAPKKINSDNYIRSNKENLERVLKDFQINGQVVEIHIGPAVTQYEVKVPN